MEQMNYTTVPYFIIKGFTDVPDIQASIFLFTFIVYLMCLGGNLMILLLVSLDPQLHNPMYFFLSNLSFIDICSTSNTLPKSLFIYLSGDNTISFFSCMVQMYMFTLLQSDVFFILAVMGYDRYVAICNPLHYRMVMNRNVCVGLATICWVLGYIEIIPTLLGVLYITCYKSNIINHYFCDVMPIKKLSCSDMTFLELYIAIEGGLFVVFTPFILTFISYVFIIKTILRIRSSTGRRKAFYTCSSHLTVFSLLYVTIFCQYFTPESMDSLVSKNLFSLCNTALIPLLNPLIYSLKNKVVKSSLRRQLRFFKIKA